MTGGIVVEATTSSNTESLLPSKTSYAHSLSRADDELRSFQPLVSWSLFFLLGIFISIVSLFVLSYATTSRAYDMVV
uniref:Uncharacterized protein n=1 Tax=Musa acuminata subsp. malaccensis TaxID=214687 RepID=A0A804L515_MUSAM